MTSFSGVVADDLEVEEVVDSEVEEGVTEMVEGTPNSEENTSVSMTMNLDQINHRGQSRRGAVAALSMITL